MYSKTVFILDTIKIFELNIIDLHTAFFFKKKVHNEYKAITIKKGTQY